MSFWPRETLSCNCDLLRKWSAFLNVGHFSVIPLKWLLLSIRNVPPPKIIKRNKKRGKRKNKKKKNKK